MFVSSIMVSIIIIKYVNLEKLKISSCGNYIQRFMTKGMEIIRFVGFEIMILAAWFHGMIGKKAVWPY